MKHVLINISRTAPPIFKFKVSMDLSHQARLNGVVLLKINGAVLEILMKNHFVRNMFSLISQERLHRFFKRTTPFSRAWWDKFIDTLNLKIYEEISKYQRDSYIQYFLIFTIIQIDNCVPIFIGDSYISSYSSFYNTEY